MARSWLRAAALVSALLASGAALGAPPLVEAALAGDAARVDRLLAAGADPDAHDAARNTALIYAARDGRFAMAKNLIRRGATVNWIDGEGVTALILASFKGHVRLAKLLLDHGADPAIRDRWNRTALDYALRRGPDDPIAKLIRNAEAGRR